MSNRSVLEKAEAYSLSRGQVIILYRVAYWFAGNPLEYKSKHVSIGNSYEPSLQRLCGNNWEAEFSEEHEALIERGLFKSDEKELYIAGRQCRWLPTERSFDVIEHIFVDEEQIDPDWQHDHPRPPTVRDGSELMEHRKGTMAARHLFEQLERCSGAGVYPRVDLPHRPDLRLWGHGDQLARVEVITGHNDRDSWKEKFIHWSSPKAGPTIWIFDSRATMVDFWNHMLRHTTLELDGGLFGGPNKNNWAPKRVNDRVRRTREGPFNYTSTDVSWTIGGLIEADRVDAFEFLDRNNIILQS